MNVIENLKLHADTKYTEQRYMKAIHSEGVITSIRSRKDGSLGFSGETPELTTEEKVAFMSLHGVNVHMLFEPSEGSSGILKVESKMDGKTPSQRLRAVIHVLWRQTGEPYGDFEIFYRNKMENFINEIKGGLD